MPATVPGTMGRTGPSDGYRPFCRKDAFESEASSGARPMNSMSCGSGQPFLWTIIWP